jgi:putative ABC transport system ATP-binding protein
MQLKCNHIIPLPLKENLPEQSEVWGRELIIGPSEKIFFNAPSGKGKSTFIHILYGLRKDFEGDVSWSGRSLKTQTEAQWAAWRSKELSIVFQDLRLFDDLDLMENILIKQSLAAGSAGMEQAEEWLEILGMAHKKNQKAGLLSYGEKQRVAIVRALLQPFSWLLLDEPFSHLDEGNIQKAAGLISGQLAARNAGLLMVDLENSPWFSFDKKLRL